MRNITLYSEHLQLAVSMKHLAKARTHDFFQEPKVASKFIYSEKATKYDEMTKCFDASKYVFPNIIWRFRQILVAF